MKYIKQHKLSYLGLAIMVAALSACSDDDDDNVNSTTDDITPSPAIYEVSLTNITQGQIFSPPAVLTHSPQMPLWTAGTSASVALEALAEGGDTSQLSSLAGIEQSIASTGPILPGETMNWSVELSEMDAQALSLATMLINTNDGFTGLTDMDLSNLSMGDSYQKMLMVYDAGTEMNDEIAMPGSGGEAFNASREGDVDRVYAHAGVLTSIELNSSVLLPEHKFDNPAGKLIIKRVQ